jgi:toxin ParE1/3/4
MTAYRLSPQAERDIEAILEWSHEEFGERVRHRYGALLTQAILDVAEDPERLGSQARPKIAAGARTYHIRLSRDRVAKSVGRIRQPRHFLLYQVRGSRVEIIRVLHDGMDLERHLPTEYRTGGSEEDVSG